MKNELNDCRTTLERDLNTCTCICRTAIYMECLLINNESTAGADASVKSLKLYDMKQLTLAYLALLGSSSSRSLYNCKKWEIIDRDRC